jgi:hypothetical protein
MAGRRTHDETDRQALERKAREHWPHAERERQERIAREEGAERHNENEREKLIAEYEQEQRELAEAAEVTGESPGITAHRGETKAQDERPSNAYLARRNLRRRAYQDDQREKRVAAEAEAQAEHARRVQPQIDKKQRELSALEDEARRERERHAQALSNLKTRYEQVEGEIAAISRPPEQPRQMEAV